MSKALVNKKKLNKIFNVIDYGAVGDGTTDDHAAITAAATAAAGVGKLFFPVGTYLLTNTLRVPSNSNWYGCGPLTEFKMKSDVVRDKSVIVTGHLADHRTNITLENFKVNYNSARHANADGTGLGNGTGNVLGSGDGADQSGLVICNSSFVRVNNVHSYDAWKHCIDVTAPSYRDSDPEIELLYDPEPSHDVWLNNCYAEGAGDDNITTHHSYNIHINGCLSKDPSGVRTNDNTNCYEIDDGSRHVFITNSRAVGGVCGLQIKGHAQAPAPFDIHVNNFTTINAIMGVEVRHTDWYGVKVDDDGTVRPPTVNEDGEVIGSYGKSPMARDVFLHNINIMAPRNTVATYSSDYTDEEWALDPGVTLKARGGMRIRSYENVLCTNINVVEAAEDTTGDYLPYIDMDGVPVRIYGGATNVTIQNLAVRGFATGIGYGTINTTTDTWDDPLPDGQKAAVLVTGSFGDGLFIDGLTILDGPAVGIRATTGVDNVSLENYNITSDNADTPNSYGIYFTGADTRKTVGSGYAVGFRKPVSNESSNIVVRKSAGNSGTVMPMYEMTWEEGLTNDLAAGEGGKITMKVKLVADTEDTEVAALSYEKVDNNDSSRASNVKVKVSSDGTAAPTTVMQWGADQSVTTSGAQYVNTRAIVSAASTTVLDSADHFVVVTGSTTHTLTLPAATTGRVLYLKNRSSGTVTVNAAGSDTFDSGTSNSMSTNNGRVLIANGTNWCTVSNS